VVRFTLTENQLFVGATTCFLCHWHDHDSCSWMSRQMQACCVIQLMYWSQQCKTL